MGRKRYVELRSYSGNSIGPIMDQVSSWLISIPPKTQKNQECAFYGLDIFSKLTLKKTVQSLKEQIASLKIPCGKRAESKQAKQPQAIANQLILLKQQLRKRKENLKDLQGCQSNIFEIIEGVCFELFLTAPGATLRELEPLPFNFGCFYAQYFRPFGLFFNTYLERTFTV